MADEMHVVTEDLRAHASKVDGVGDQMRSAVDAARQVTMNDDAYGLLCQPFAMMLQPFEENGVEALQKAVDALGKISENIRATAEDYLAVDDDQASTIDGVEVP